MNVLTVGLTGPGNCIRLAIQAPATRSAHPKNTRTIAFFMGTMFLSFLLLNSATQATETIAATRGTTELLSPNIVPRDFPVGSVSDSVEVSGSADGRYAAFASDAPDLVPNDNNGFSDIFVRDRYAKQTVRVSVGPGGVEGNGPSLGPVISGNGRLIAFISHASNLVTGDTNSQSDVFLHDRVTHTTRLVVPPQFSGYNHAGARSLTMSSDGNWLGIMFHTTGEYEADFLVLYDVIANGFIEVYYFVPGCVVLPHIDICAESSISPRGLSADGRFLAYITNVWLNYGYGKFSQHVDLNIYDRVNASSKVVVLRRRQVFEIGPGTAGNPAISANGAWIAFQSDIDDLVNGDTNGVSDIFLTNRLTGAFTRVSVDSRGLQGNNASVSPVLSADGRFVAFASLADNLVSGDTNNSQDVFVHDRATQTTRRASVSWSGRQGNAESRAGDISADGRYVAFDSIATNLTKGDVNKESDVFLRDRLLQPGNVADLGVSQVASVEPVKIGSPLTYTITAVNHGPDWLQGVTLIELLPWQARFVSASSRQGACSGGKLIVCRLGPLLPNAHATVSLTVIPDKTGHMVNDAFANGAAVDHLLRNNTSSLASTVIP